LTKYIGRVYQSRPLKFQFSNGLARVKKWRLATRETGIPLRNDKNGILNLDEDEVKETLKKHFEKEKVNVFSFWTT